MSLPSAEVAADFKDALQDLKINSRPEISNLTIIAKENTEHAQAISRELENHIKTTRPEWKLPALYVLDSIVKNVGTPYTVYLGRNLYRTFMDAYMLMDEPTRKAMEGLLRTWKQSVPESMDPRPVFSPEVTRDIENALIKYRTIAVQQAQRTQRPPLHQGMPSRPGMNVPHRNTPTPPQNGGRYTPSNDPRVRQSAPPQQFGGQYPPGVPAASQFQAPFPDPHQRSNSVDLGSINADLDRLINVARTEFSLKPTEVSVQQKLKALLDLQTILRTQTLPPAQLSQIKAQIQQLSTPPPAPAVPASLPPSFPVPLPVPTPPQQVPTPVQPAGTPLNLAQILANAARPPVQHSPAPASTSLADLLRQTSSPANIPQFPNPLFPPAPGSALPPPPPAPAAPAAPPNLAQLLQQFGKPAATPIPPPVPLPPAVPSQTPAVPGSIGGADWLLAALKSQNLIPPTGVPPFPPPAGMPPVLPQPMVRTVSNSDSNVPLTTAAMKQPRPDLVSTLYDAIPNRCVTCGRRFENTPDGKERKARHMDWHFKIKDPELANRNVHRTWFIDEREWIDYTEVDETAPPEEQGPATQKKETKDQYVPVPTDARLVHAPCPICQEKFEPQWHVDASDFVWMDAVKVGGKIYHATCWEEYNKGVGSGAAPGTPDSVLGKRKAEGYSNGSEKKFRA